jgi:hypothetical protein
MAKWSQPKKRKRRRKCAKCVYDTKKQKILEDLTTLLIDTYGVLTYFEDGGNAPLLKNL